VGQSAGILAFLIFLFLWLYPLRKKVKALAFTGSIARWLDVHVTAALALPLLLAIHSAWRSDGVIGIGFGAILVVCLSGVIGRYLYVRIPRARNGVALTLEEVTAQRQSIVQRIASATGLVPDEIERSLAEVGTAATHANPLRVLWRLLTNDIRRWRKTRQLRRRWMAVAPRTRRVDRRAIGEAVKLASREMLLGQQSRMLEATQRVFRYWHVAHRPVALTALVAVMVHVAVVVAVGATWFR
jgi:hypothetical protein